MSVVVWIRSAFPAAVACVCCGLPTRCEDSLTRFSPPRSRPRKIRVAAAALPQAPLLSAAAPLNLLSAAAPPTLLRAAVRVFAATFPRSETLAECGSATSVIIESMLLMFWPISLCVA